MPTLEYHGKTFIVTYRPFAQSDVTATQEIIAGDVAGVKRHWEKQFSGQIVSIEER